MCSFTTKFDFDTPNVTGVCSTVIRGLGLVTELGQWCCYLFLTRSGCLLLSLVLTGLLQLSDLVKNQLISFAVETCALYCWNSVKNRVRLNSSNCFIGVLAMHFSNYLFLMRRMCDKMLIAYRHYL